jgi:ribosomal protein S27AE
MKSSQNLLLVLLAFFAFACGQPRSARQDEAEEKAEAAEMLTEENLEVAAEETPGDIDDSEESDQSKGTSEPEPEPHPETEPEPEPEGSAANSDEKLEESDDLGQPTNTSKKCEKCFRSAFRARHSEFCDGCGGSEAGAKPLEKDADRLRRKCRRCSNSKFAEKHQNFCTIRCKDLQQSITSEPTPTPEPEHRPIPSGDLKKKKKKERKKGQRKANKKKDVELPEDEMSSSSLSIPLKDPNEEEELGPLENLIKYIIHQK